MKTRILQVLFIFSVLLSLSALMASKVIAAAGDTGAIWTTDSSCGENKKNQYVTGEMVWISGHQFEANEALTWSVTKIGGGTVVSGSVTAQVKIGEENKGGQFCVSAYTITANDSGVFKVKVSDNKNSNFQANPGVANPSVTPVTPTVETPSVPTTVTPEQQPSTTPPTETQVLPTETPVAETPQPQVTPLPTENPSQTATSVPVQTETSSPTQASTNAATQSPQEAPVTGSLADPAILQGASALFGLVSLGSYALLKRKSD